NNKYQRGLPRSARCDFIAMWSGNMRVVVECCDASFQLWSSVAERGEHFENRNPKSRRYDAMLRDENASVLEIVHSLMNEYNCQRNSGEWVDAPQHHHHHHPDGSNDRKMSPSSFVATHGAVFEDYCEGRVWFVVWESALAVAVSVLSAVAGAATGACNALQIVGAVLQMAGLVMLVVARPHREARALCVGVAM
ncbi:transmembrane protein, putative, partial [Bodo saltans]